MNILITICARGGSKGIPGKNTKMLSGKPLLAYTIAQAQRFAESRGTDIALSTDDPDMRAVAATYGLHTEYLRPPELATDSAGKEAAMRYVLQYEEERRGKTYDMLLDLDVTSPLRTQEDLEAGLSILEAHPQALNLYSVNPAHRNPYFNMVEQGADGYYHLCKKPTTPILSRQVAPKVYDLNASFYFFRRTFFDAGWKTPFSDRALIYAMPHICFDLDTPEDFLFLEYLMEKQLLGFAL